MNPDEYWSKHEDVTYAGNKTIQLSEDRSKMNSHQILEYTMSVSMREFTARYGDQVIQHILAKLENAVASKLAEVVEERVEAIMEGPTFQQMIDHHIKETIRLAAEAEIRKAVQERVEEVFG